MSKVSVCCNTSVGANQDLGTICDNCGNPCQTREENTLKQPLLFHKNVDTVASDGTVNLTAAPQPDSGRLKLRERVAKMIFENRHGIKWGITGTIDDASWRRAEENAFNITDSVLALTASLMEGAFRTEIKDMIELYDKTFLDDDYKKLWTKKYGDVSLYQALKASVEGKT